MFVNSSFSQSISPCRQIPVPSGDSSRCAQFDGCRDTQMSGGSDGIVTRLVLDDRGIDVRFVSGVDVVFHYTASRPHFKA
jgi:hypothetical protein